MSNPERRRRIAIAMLAVAHLPLLCSYAQQLWAREQYQFFPFAILALVVLVRQRADCLLQRWSIFCTLLVAGDIVLLAFAAFLNSTFLSAAAAACLGSAVLLSTRDAVSRRSFAYLIPMLLIVVRPPLGLDQRLVTEMQAATTKTASGILDRLGYVHHRAGNVIELPDKDLLLEEACSGIQSLLTVLFVAVFVAAYHRRAFLHTIVLLLAGVGWAFALNTTRIVTLAVTWQSLRFDLTQGLPHELLGYLFLILSLGLLVSTDGLTRFLLGPIKEAKKRSRTDGWGPDIFVRLWNRLGGPAFLFIPAGLRPALSGDRTGSGVWKYSLPLAAVASVTLLATQFSVPFAWAETTERSASHANLLNRSDLPALLSGLQQANYAVEKRNRKHVDGEFSNTWMYSIDESSALHVSCDHVFSCWHSLETCYVGRGWTVDTKQLLRTEGTEWHGVEVEFSNSAGQKAWLVYSLFDETGEPAEPPEASVSASLVDRLQRKRSAEGTRLYQTQVFVELTDRLPDAVRQQYVAAHIESRSAIRDAVQARLSGGQ